MYQIRVEGGEFVCLVIGRVFGPVVGIPAGTIGTAGITGVGIIGIIGDFRFADSVVLLFLLLASDVGGGKKDFP